MRSQKALLAGGCVLVAACFVGTAMAPAQRGQPKSKADLRTQEVTQALERFLRHLSQGEVEAGFKEILQGSLVAQEQEQVAQLQAKAQDAVTAYGEFVDIEPLSREQVGSSLLFLRYLYKCGDLPLVWYFTYYRPTPDDPWRLVAIRYDLEFEALRRDAAQVAPGQGSQES